MAVAYFAFFFDNEVTLQIKENCTLLIANDNTYILSCIVRTTSIPCFVLAYKGRAFDLIRLVQGILPERLKKHSAEEELAPFPVWVSPVPDGSRRQKDGECRSWSDFVLRSDSAAPF